MKLTLRILMLASVLIDVIANAQKVAQPSCTLSTPVTIDGNASEWAIEWQTQPDAKFIYNICSDADNLYIRWQTSDNATKRKVGVFGFTLWLDPSGKKKKKLGLKYPVGARGFGNWTPDIVQAQGENGNRGNRDRGRNMLRNTDDLELLGLAKESIPSSRFSIMNGIQVMIAADSDLFVYEAKIPFKAFRINKADVKEMSIGMETGHLDQSSVPPGGYSGGGMRGGGMGGGGMGRGSGGGGMGRGPGGTRPSGGGAGPSDMQQSEKVWVKVILN